MFDSFQNQYTWQFFCSRFFKHSNGNNPQNFSNGTDFYFFPEETEGFFKNKLDFLKTD